MYMKEAGMEDTVFQQAAIFLEKLMRRYQCLMYFGKDFKLPEKRVMQASKGKEQNATKDTFKITKITPSTK